MSLPSEKIKKVSELSPSERVAGYLFYSTKLAMIGARLRKDNRADESWTVEEEQEWDDCCDELDGWWYALSKEEREFIEPAQLVISVLTRGELNSQGEGQINEEEKKEKAKE